MAMASDVNAVVPSPGSVVAESTEMFGEMPARRGLLLLDDIRQPAATKAFQEATEVSLVAAGPHPERRWKPPEWPRFGPLTPFGLDPSV